MLRTIVRSLGRAALVLAGCAPPPVAAPQPLPAPAAAAPTEPRPEQLLIDDDVGLAELQPPAVLSPAEAARDHAWLEHALHHGYGARDLVAPEVLDELFAELARCFAVTEPIEPSALCHDVANALYRIPDAHLSVALGGHECLADGVEPLQGNVGPNVGPRFPAETKVPWSVQTAADGRVGVLSITRYPFSGSAVWNGLLEAVQALEQHDAIIIDLRGNSGGDDTTAYRVAQVLSGRFLRRDHAHKVSLHTSTAFVLQINAITLAIAEAERTGQPVDALLELRRDRFERLRAAQRGEEPRTVREPLGPQQPLPGEFAPYQGRVILLVDRRCGSSCETGLEVLRQIPGAVVMGENTAGALHSGNAGRLLLPHGKLLVTIPMHHTRYEDGSFYERVGLAPDVRVPPGEDALEHALAYLRRDAARSEGGAGTAAGQGTAPSPAAAAAPRAARHRRSAASPAAAPR